MGINEETPVFTITDKDIQERAATTVLRCDECGGIETVYDQPYDEQAQEAAERIHSCPPMCVVCGEPIGAESMSGFACDPCRNDDPAGALAAMAEYTRTAPTDEWLARILDSGARIDAMLASTPLAS